MGENYEFNIASIKNEQIVGDRVSFRIVFEENYWADISYDKNNTDRATVTPGSEEDTVEVEELIYNLNENIYRLWKLVKENEWLLMIETLAK